MVQSEILEAKAKMSRHAIIHSTSPFLSESVFEGFAYNCTRLLICNNLREVKIDQEIVRKDSKYLQKDGMMAYFVGGKQTNGKLT